MQSHHFDCFRNSDDDSHSLKTLDTAECLVVGVQSVPFLAQKVS